MLWWPLVAEGSTVRAERHAVCDGYEGVGSLLAGRICESLNDEMLREA